MDALYHLHNAIIVGLNNEELIEDRQFILDNYKVDNIITKQQPEDASIFIELLSNIYADKQNLILFNAHYELEKETAFINNYSNLNEKFTSNTKLILIGGQSNPIKSAVSITRINRPLFKSVIDNILSS